MLSNLFRRLRRRRRTRGQSLVEFALVLPILLLIVLITVDFGRALYGWVVLQNSARIAANYAGTHPEGWQGAGEPAVVDEYEALILNDLDTANCSAAAIPDPVFTDGPDTAVAGGNADSNYDVGDTVVVGLDCDFTPLTPIISAVVGNIVTLSADSQFRIRAGDLVGLANPTKMPPPPPPPTPTPVPTPTPAPSSSASASPTATPTGTPCTASVVISRTPNGALQSGGSATFTGAVTISGCTVASYAWTFPQGAPATATSAGPHTVTFTTSSNTTVEVRLTITTSAGTTAFDTESVRVNR